MQDPLQNVCSVLPRAYGPTAMELSTDSLIGRAIDTLDLLIDFATLGEYGLEQVPADGLGGEGTGRTSGWEALAPARRAP